eukprot:m.53539 g.53539  ORF g.53539 m.53539 type:complete len:485 (-) comp21775_c0_seq1:123-1577(-)
MDFEGLPLELRLLICGDVEVVDLLALAAVNKGCYALYTHALARVQYVTFGQVLREPLFGKLLPKLKGLRHLSLTDFNCLSSTEVDTCAIPQSIQELQLNNVKWREDMSACRLLKRCSTDSLKSFKIRGSGDVALRIRRRPKSPPCSVLLPLLSTFKMLQTVEVLIGSIIRDAEIWATMFVNIVSSCQSLRSIKLNVAGLNNEFCTWMRDLLSIPITSVEELGFIEGMFDDAALALVLPMFPNLVSLDLQQNQTLRAQTNWGVVDGSRIISLNTHGVGLPTAAAFERLATWFPNVETLHAGGSKLVSGVAIRTIRKAFGCLTHLNLNGCESLGDVALSNLRIPTLKTLDISHKYEQWCEVKKLRKISDDGVTSLTRGCPALTSLNMSYLRRVSAEKTLKRLVAKLKLQTLQAPGLMKPCTYAAVASIVAETVCACRLSISVLQTDDWSRCHPRIINTTIVKSSLDRIVLEFEICAPPPEPSSPTS